MTAFPPAGSVPRGSSSTHPVTDHPAGFARDRDVVGHPVNVSSPWGTQWGAIVAGAFTGLAVAVVLATLGAALGLTGGAIAASDPAVTTTTAAEAASTAAGVGIGAGIWLLITALVVGLAGGGVLAKLSIRERPYHAPVLGVVTWACGLTMAVLLAAVAGGGALATGLGLGGGAAATAAGMSDGSMDTRNATNAPATAEASLRRDTPLTTDETGRRTLTPAERDAAREAAEEAATTAATAAWFALIGQLLGLGATIFAAKRFR